MKVALDAKLLGVFIHLTQIQENRGKEIRQLFFQEHTVFILELLCSGFYCCLWEVTSAALLQRQS